MGANEDDFTIIRNCIRYEFLELFRGLSLIRGNYYYKLLPSQRDIRIYIEDMGQNTQYLIEYNYKLHTYDFHKCSRYRNENLFIYTDNGVPDEISSYFLEKIMTPRYREKKLIKKTELQENGYYLLNKIVNAYYNPHKKLCQIVMEKSIEHIYQEV